MNLSELTQYNPTPTSFPYDNGDTFFGFEGYPTALSNGFILDMDLPRKDMSLRKEATKIYPKSHLVSAFHYLGDNVTKPISEPSDVHIEDNLLVFSVKHCVTQSIFKIQVRHWNYLRYRYPNCVFLQGRCEHADILVKNKDKIVGVVTPAWNKA